MKKIDLGQAAALLANVGVIVGIAFLAFELNQNNKLLRAEAEHNYLEGRLNTRRQIIYDPEFAAFTLKAASGEPLSPVDQLRVNTAAEASFLGRQWEYGQFLDGNLSVTAEELALQWRQGFESKSEYEKDMELMVWSELRSTLRDGYVQFMEESVFSD